jgi:hypothetical protein
VFVFRHELIGLREFRWEMRVVSPARLVSGTGEVYAFR